MEEAVDPAEHLVELLDDPLEVQLPLPLPRALSQGGRLSGVAAPDDAQHLESPKGAAGLEARQVAEVADLLDGGTPVHVGQDLLLLFREVEARVRVRASRRHEDGLDVPQGADDLLPRMRVADALQDQVLRRHVEHGHVVARVELLDDELVLAADPGEQVHQDALDVHLHRGDQLFRPGRMRLLASTKLRTVILPRMSSTSPMRSSGLLLHA